MPQKALDLVLPEELKVLVYGESGVGKTVFATTFPKPILFFDFDDGRQTYGGLPEIDYELYTEDPASRRPKAYQNFIKDLDKFGKDHDGYKTFVLDSTTFLQDAIINDIIGTQGATPQGGITLPQWQIVTNRFADIFRKIKGYKANFVTVGHEQIIQDEVTGEIKILTVQAGRKFAAKAPLYFDEVYRCYVDHKAKDSVTHKVQTSACKKYPARSRLNTQDKNGKIAPILDQYEPADFQTIMDKVVTARERGQQ